MMLRGPKGAILQDLPILQIHKRKLAAVGWLSFTWVMFKSGHGFPSKLQHIHFIRAPEYYHEAVYIHTLYALYRPPLCDSVPTFRTTLLMGQCPRRSKPEQQLPEAHLGFPQPG